MMINELLEQIRHDCRNAVTCIQHDIKSIEEARTLIGKCLIDIATEQARIERAINFLDILENNDKD